MIFGRYVTAIGYLILETIKKGSEFIVAVTYTLPGTQEGISFDHKASICFDSVTTLFPEATVCRRSTKRCPKKFRKIHRKIPLSEPRF